jgi:predicted GH43/DUF377 family glycosyl hydrolase
MFIVTRSHHNPLLTPNTNYPWEAEAVFNWSPVKDSKDPRKTHVVYRAMSVPELHLGVTMSVSTIGYASTKNGIDFPDRRQLIAPEYEWEKYGCEDPRVTYLDGTYYIFYTAIGKYPPGSEDIKVAVATTKDFKTIDEKHLVTPFDSKAMTLFPEKINGKYVVALSVNTDKPPAKIAFAEFDRIEDIWNHDLWKTWYQELDKHSIDPRRSPYDHVEVGSQPIKTEQGWLLIYSHIENYFASAQNFVKVFGIEALLLDLHDPRKIIGKTRGPMFVDQETYEKFGQTPQLVFPSGALLFNDKLQIFYGAADTVCAVASIHLNDLLLNLRPDAMNTYLTRYEKNPILLPRPQNAWEAKAVFNPGVLAIGDTTYIIYRAMSGDNTSLFGYALTRDGYTIEERRNLPCYVPREEFEMKKNPGGNSGCEDPRLTLLGDTIYMCYTAYNGIDLPRVALTSISYDDFKNELWNWKKPVLISPPNVDDKDACIFPEIIRGKYLILHRVKNDICADYVDSLEPGKVMLSSATPILLPRHGMWDGDKVGITAPPIKTEKGWLLLYHGVSSNHHTYRVGMALLDLEDPTKVIARAATPIFEPKEKYEMEGQVPNVVFPCGLVQRDGMIFVYYGGADSVVALATVPLKKLLSCMVE